MSEVSQTQSLVKSGTFLAGGIAVAGILTVVFNFLVTRIDGPTVYSSIAPLLNIGAVAGVASAGVQNTALSAIVTQRSFQPLQRQSQHLAFFSIALLLLTPIIAIFLRVSYPASVTSLVFAGVTLLSCLPVAMLMSRSLFASFVALNLGVAVARIAGIVYFRRFDPVITALVISITAIAAGAVLMAWLAMRGSHEYRESPSSASIYESGGLGKYLLGVVLYLPIALPTWTARHDLSPKEAGIFSLAALMGTTIVMFAGPVTSVVISRLNREDSWRTIKSGAWLTLTFAVVSSLAIIFGAPFVLSKVFTIATNGIGAFLPPLCIGAVCWSIISYLTWVRASQSGKSSLFIIGAIAAILIEVVAPLVIHKSLLIAWTPAIGAAVYAVCWLILRARVNARSDNVHH